VFSFLIITVLMVLVSILVIEIPEYLDKRSDILSIFSSLAALLVAIVGYSSVRSKPNQ